MEKDRSLVLRFYDSIPSSQTGRDPSLSPQLQVILYCCQLLLDVHIAAQAQNTQLGIRDWKHVNALFDVIIVLGVYKSLPSGVGIPQSRRIQSGILAQEQPRHLVSEEEKRAALIGITAAFKTIINEGGEISDALRNKHLVDYIAVLANLAFNPDYSSDPQAALWKSEFKELLSR